MAPTKRNIIMRFFTGKLGGLIFKMWGDKTVATEPPKKKYLKWTEVQKTKRKGFAEAMHWATNAMKDPELKKYYEGLSNYCKKRKKIIRSPYNIAVSNFLTPPKINVVEIMNYKGKKGDIIRVDAMGKYQVARDRKS